jgi:betaine-aldehyde dehydrogenase
MSRQTWLDLPSQRDLVDGVQRDVENSGKWLTDPNTGERTHQSAQSATDVVDDALDVADRLHRSGEWGTAPLENRLALLEAFATSLAARTDSIAFADAMDSGVPLSITTMFAAALPDVVRGAVELARSMPWDRELRTGAQRVHLLTLPWGPAAIIAPFNAPAFTVVKKSAYALAAGCPVIVKPSSQAPHSANLIVDAFVEAIEKCGAPRSVFQLVHGDARVGQQLASSSRVRALAFTGGRNAGRAIARAASDHFPALQLECGSNNPVIVRDDADLDATADSLASGFTKLNGQWCESPGTVFVAATLHDELLERLGSLVVGSSLDPAANFGPQANIAQRNTIVSAIERLERGGGKQHSPQLDFPPVGYFLPPIVITGVDPTDTVEELFGPVLVLHPVVDDDQALVLANSRSGGLAGYVFSSDLPAATALAGRITAGEVKINGTSVLDMHADSAQSFWEGSGVGGHGNLDLLRFFTGSRIVGVDPPGMPL